MPRLFDLHSADSRKKLAWLLRRYRSIYPRRGTSLQKGLFWRLLVTEAWCRNETADALDKLSWRAVYWVLVAHAAKFEYPKR